MSALNTFLVKYFVGDKKILDTNVEHWNEYITTLKACDKITINDTEYRVGEINMIHNTQTSGLVIEVNVELKELNRKLKVSKKPEWL